MKQVFILATALLFASCGADTPPAQTAETPVVVEKIGAYMIVQGRDYDSADLGQYAASLPPIYKKYGGRYVAFSTDYDVAEGSYDAKAIIISSWPDAATARKFWDSPEYRDAVKLREGIGEFDVVIVPALPQ